MNWDVSTGPLARPFTHSLAPLAHLLASPCLLCLHALLRSFVCSLPSSWESKLLNCVNIMLFWTIEQRLVHDDIDTWVHFTHKIDNTWDGPMDGWMDGQSDITLYRDVLSHLKVKKETNNDRGQDRMRLPRHHLLFISFHFHLSKSTFLISQK